MTKYLRLLVTGIVGLFLALAPSAVLAAKRVALVVGNSNYHNVARLPNPERDATAVAKLFKDAGFDAVITAIDVGNLDFKRAIRNFEDAAIDADIAVVYYAGHGLEVGGINYLVPVDAKLASDRDAEDEAISLNRVVESVDAAKRLRLVILDACRDDPFVVTMKRRTALRSVSSGLAEVEPTSTETLIAYAAKAGSTAEDGAGAHSPFTTALLDNLTVPGLDIRLAFGRVRDEVMKITGNRQEPFVYGSLGGENISLVPAPEKPQAPDIAREQSDYQLVAQIGNKKAWEVFLSTYPTGFYADLAREQLAKLESTAVPPEPSAPPQPAKPTADELKAWNAIKNTSDRAALEKFIELHSDSPLARDAQNRLDVLDRAAREQEEKARAAREAAERAEQQRRADEAARIAAQQRAEEEQRAATAARLAELQAEAERRAKEAAESEKQKQEQAARIAALQAEIDRRTKELAEAESQKAELACRREQDRLAELKAAGSSAAVRDDLKRLSDELSCERLRPQVVAALDKVTSELKESVSPPPPTNTADLIAAAQKELTRLGCYSGSHNGKLDADTKVAIKKYKAQKQQPVTTEVAVTQSFVDELGRQKLRVCPAAVVNRPASEAHHEQPRREAKKGQGKPSKPEAKRTASQQAGGGSHATTIGIGF